MNLICQFRNECHVFAKRFVKSNTRKLISRNFVWKYDRFTLHSVRNEEFTTAMQIFSSNQFRVNFFDKKLLSRNLFRKVKFRNFGNYSHNFPMRVKCDILIFLLEKYFVKSTTFIQFLASSCQHKPHLDFEFYVSLSTLLCFLALSKDLDTALPNIH